MKSSHIKTHTFWVFKCKNIGQIIWMDEPKHPSYLKQLRLTIISYPKKFTVNKILCALYTIKVFPYGGFRSFLSTFPFTYFSFTSFPIPVSCFYFWNILFQLSPHLIFMPWHLESTWISSNFRRYSWAFMGNGKGQNPFLTTWRAHMAFLTVALCFIF